MAFLKVAMLKLLFEFDVVTFAQENSNYVSSRAANSVDI